MPNPEMSLPRPTPTSKTLREQFSPGGYLHDGTSDTQVFGFSASQSRAAGRVASPPPQYPSDFDLEQTKCRGYSQGDPANPYNADYQVYSATSPEHTKRHFARTELSPITDNHPRPVPEAPPPKRRHREVDHPTPTIAVCEGDHPIPTVAVRKTDPPTLTVAIREDDPPTTATAKERHVERLANLLCGPAYANGRNFPDFPLLKMFGGTRIYEKILSPDTIQEVSSEEKAFVTQFFEACWHSDAPDAMPRTYKLYNAPNAVQLEYLAVFIELVKHLPLFMHTIMDVDRADTMVLTLESMGRIIHAMQILTGVQRRAEMEIAP
ncbi:hypothetical protein B0H17DRAFT_1138582 [Mycena rosella]|uniref:Uncharacterized protein n=1 Tax=Mycena rosella TaxID=1033263 RepID=A0AAD7D634_MYCRO|nr:hypothetical protein B0H17DRAFT_1138582 [Mycena rosella]